MKRAPTLTEIFLAFLGDPPTYLGLPVDLSSLEKKVVKGMVVPAGLEPTSSV